MPRTTFHFHMSTASRYLFKLLEKILIQLDTSGSSQQDLSDSP